MAVHRGNPGERGTTDGSPSSIAIVLSLAFSCAGDVCLLFDCSIRATVLLDYISNIIWNIDIPPMINKSL